MISFKSIKNIDCKQLKNLVDQTLGYNYYQEHELKKILKEEANFCIGAFHQEGLIGALWTKAVPFEMLNERLNSVHFKNTKTILDIIVVNPDFQKKGIGQTMVSMIPFENIIVLAWKSKNGVNLEHLLKANNFIEEFEIPNAYYNDSLKRKYTCPDCGEPPCKCAAILYKRTSS